MLSPSLKKQTMDVEDEESDDDDWDLSKFGRLDPLTESLPVPLKGVKTFTRDNIHEFDLEKELFTPDFPGDILGDKACWKSYFQQIDQSEGFDIKDFPGYGPMTTIHPISPSEEIKGYAAQALELYNEDNGTKYEVNEILKVNRACTGYFSFYITFTVTNGNGEKIYLQAQVDRDVDQSLECAIIRPRAKGGTTVFPMPYYLEAPSNVEKMKDYAAKALEHYNKKNDTKYEVNEILKVNGDDCGQYSIFYITFSVNNGEKEYFQAKVVRCINKSLRFPVVRPRAKGGVDI